MHVYYVLDNFMYFLMLQEIFILILLNIFDQLQLLNQYYLSTINQEMDLANFHHINLNHFLTSIHPNIENQIMRIIIFYFLYLNKNHIFLIILMINVGLLLLHIFYLMFKGLILLFVKYEALVIRRRLCFQGFCFRIILLVIFCLIFDCLSMLANNQ